MTSPNSGISATKRALCMNQPQVSPCCHQYHCQWLLRCLAAGRHEEPGGGTAVPSRAGALAFHHLRRQLRRHLAGARSSQGRNDHLSVWPISACPQSLGRGLCGEFPPSLCFCFPNIQPGRSCCLQALPPSLPGESFLLLFSQSRWRQAPPPVHFPTTATARP